MPVYLLHGFKWHRTGKHGIIVYIIVRSLDDASADYIQNPRTTRSLRRSLELGNPDITSQIPELHFIEQYDPDDLSTNAAVCQPYAFTANKVVTIADNLNGLSLNVDEVIEQGTGLSESGMKAMEELRDKLAPGEKIGWHIVYNGDPERAYPGMSDDEIESDSSNYEDDDDNDTEMTEDSKDEPDMPKARPVGQASTSAKTGKVDKSANAEEELPSPQTVEKSKSIVSTVSQNLWHYHHFTRHHIEAAWSSNTRADRGPFLPSDAAANPMGSTCQSSRLRITRCEPSSHVQTLPAV
ncbi:hypothetical protein FQN54_000102 [Arachnomyces sp. PD_36]|nr:hypothetical protein FQN54_000102 [Arachnomyces sp. PD_36]